MANVELREVTKSYGNQGTLAVKPLTIEIKDKEFVVIVGPSGCGKSTTLRMIAGLESISGGGMYIDNELVNYVDSKDRDIAMVFQNYALYPYMTIAENIGFPLKMQKAPKALIKERVKEVAEILQLTPFLKRKPDALSGGQRQRVALGRAMVRQPKVFLLDEPLSNLDAKLRVEMRAEIVKLHRELETTFIYVTHDQTEAMTMGDRIVVLRDGHLEQMDTPINLYESPKTKFVAEFIGSPQMNVFPTQLLYENLDVVAVSFNDKGVELGQVCKDRLKTDVMAEQIYAGIRPEHLILTDETDPAAIRVQVENIEHLGHNVNVFFTTSDRPEALAATIAVEDAPAVGDFIYLKADANRWHLFDRHSELSLFEPLSL